MRKLVTRAFCACLALLLVSWFAVAETKAQPSYAKFFTDEALRVDLVHTGTRGAERFGLVKLTAEPVWPGSRAFLIDPNGFGSYRIRVFDQATNQEIFSQGYCSLFGEWLASDEDNPKVPNGPIRSCSRNGASTSKQTGRGPRPPASSAALRAHDPGGFDVRDAQLVAPAIGRRDKNCKLASRSISGHVAMSLLICESGALETLGQQR